MFRCLQKIRIARLLAAAFAQARVRKIVLPGALLLPAVLLVAMAFLFVNQPLAAQDLSAPDSFVETIDPVQAKIVKIYGAGGLRGLEAYQSGMLISADGLVLTVWSYVLDVDPILVVLDDGRKFEAKLKGYDPRVEIALLKLEATELPHFDLDAAKELASGDRVLAFSNLFGVATGDEDASVLHGHVSAITSLDARRGAFQSTYSGRIYVVDAMTNNPGAAGGALTDAFGGFAGMLGKELRSSSYNIWLNYAIPASELREPVAAIREGRWDAGQADRKKAKPVDPLKLSLLGISLIHNALPETPPYVDRVIADSPAQQQGLLADDLILFLNDRLMRSCRDVEEELSFVERDQEINIVIRRGTDVISMTVASE